MHWVHEALKPSFVAVAQQIPQRVSPTARAPASAHLPPWSGCRQTARTSPPQSQTQAPARCRGWLQCRGGWTCLDITNSSHVLVWAAQDACILAARIVPQRHIRRTAARLANSIGAHQPPRETTPDGGCVALQHLAAQRGCIPQWHHQAQPHALAVVLPRQLHLVRSVAAAGGPAEGQVRPSMTVPACSGGCGELTSLVELGLMPGAKGLIMSRQAGSNRAVGKRCEPPEQART